MYIKPQEYLKELKNRIDELKKELEEIEPVYNAMVQSGIVETAEKASKVPYQPLKEEPEPDLSSFERISLAQKERHKKLRDKKVPIIKKVLQDIGPSSLQGISKRVHMTSAAVKKIVAENPAIFRINANKLWELVK